MLIKKCKYCQKEFTGVNSKKYCSVECREKDKFPNTGIRVCEYCHQEYYYIKGQKNWILNKKSIDSSKFCCYECGKKYINEKRKQTNLNKYGVENISQFNSIKEKKLQTFHSHSNEWNNKRILKIKETWKNKDINQHIQKIKNTKLEKYGDSNYNNINKIKITMKRLYGKEVYAQTQKFKDLFKNKEWLENCKRNEYNSKRKNHTFNASKSEEQIYQLLLQKYSQVERQYKSNLYPFNCDFYIPSLDLYIEYQGTWEHGNKPYNENDQECINLINIWNNRNKPRYRNAMYIYIISDPKKRKIAKENNLNYLEFFNIEEFLNWYKQ